MSALIELPIHPFTGLTALGVLPSGRPVWPVLGGAPDEEQDEEETEQNDEEQDDDADDENGDDDQEEQDGDEEDKPLGPKGEKALAAMKADLREERRRRRAAEAKLKSSDGKPDAEQAATAAANRRVLRAEIKAAAKGKFADPADALTFLASKLDQFEPDENGDFDEDEITDALDDLLQRKPHLAAAKAPRFQGGGDNGARKSATKPITEEQLKKMTPDQIEKAYSEGRLKHLL